MNERMKLPEPKGPWHDVYLNGFDAGYHARQYEEQTGSQLNGTRPARLVTTEQMEDGKRYNVVYTGVARDQRKTHGGLWLITAQGEEHESHLYLNSHDTDRIYQIIEAGGQ